VKYPDVYSKFQNYSYNLHPVLLNFREQGYDSQGNLLLEKSAMHKDVVMRRKMSTAHNKFKDIFQMTKTSEESMNTLIHNLESLALRFQQMSHTTQQEQESFIGMSIPEKSTTQQEQESFIGMSIPEKSIHLVAFVKRENAREY
jgi:hypothetical protein